LGHQGEHGVPGFFDEFFSSEFFEMGSNLSENLSFWGFLQERVFEDSFHDLFGRLNDLSGFVVFVFLDFPLFSSDSFFGQKFFDSFD